MQPKGLPEHRKGYADWVDWGVDSDPTPTNVVLYYMALKASKKTYSGFQSIKTPPRSKIMVSICFIKCWCLLAFVPSSLSKPLKTS